LEWGDGQRNAKQNNLHQFYMKEHNPARWLGQSKQDMENSSTMISLYNFIYSPPKHTNNYHAGTPASSNPTEPRNVVLMVLNSTIQYINAMYQLMRRLS